MGLNVDDKVIEMLISKAEQMSPRQNDFGSTFIGLCVLVSSDEIRRNLDSIDSTLMSLDRNLEDVSKNIKLTASIIEDSFVPKI